MQITTANDTERTSNSEISLASGRPSSATSGVAIFGFIVVAIIFVGLGSWAALAPLASAVSAPANLTFKGERKSIQHFEGGIVAAIHVSEGQLIKRGDLLVSLDPLQASANVARHKAQLDQALARRARIQSELRGEKSLVIDGRLLERLSVDPENFSIVEAEQQHLTARRETLDGHISILSQRIQQLKNEIEGLKVQRASRIEQYEIFEEEIIGLRELHAKGFYPKTKLLAMERAMAQLRGAAGNDRAQIARSRSSQREAQNQIISVKQRFREEGVKDLRDVQITIADLEESLLVAKDVLKRIEIRAPRSGIIQSVQTHTIGGVIRPGDVLMEIAPDGDDLLVTAQVSPNDIDSVAVGQKAEVRLTALNVRETPAIYAVVVSVSGDRVTDPRTNEVYFLSRIEIPEEEKKKIKDIKLSAGMPAEVLIQTGERTALDYILKPVLDAFARGLNEE